MYGLLMNFLGLRSGSVLLVNETFVILEVYDNFLLLEFLALEVKFELLKWYIKACASVPIIILFFSSGDFEAASCISLKSDFLTSLYLFGSPCYSAPSFIIGSNLAFSRT